MLCLLNIKKQIVYYPSNTGSCVRWTVNSSFVHVITVGTQTYFQAHRSIN